MSIDDSLNDILVGADLSYELWAYQRFLDRVSAPHRTDDAYLFFEPRVRFSFEPEDRLVALEALTVEATASACILRQASTNLAISLDGVDCSIASRILAALSSGLTMFGVQRASGCTPQQLDAFLRATFGKAVLAPQAIERLESRISCTEIVRFVGSPYEVQRPYWANMADCRDRIQTRLATVPTRELWLKELRMLHVVALLGGDFRSYYQAQSPLGRRDARPGAFYSTATRVVEEGNLALFIDGPRVSAPTVGGRVYHAVLCQSVGDEAAMLPNREIRDKDGVDWGAVRWGLARNDDGPAAWFCPPRPIVDAHWESVFRAFRIGVEAADCRDRSALIDALANWHWYWVRLHPFRCANQSLGMNIVNSLLLRAGMAPIPHLILDQLALRLMLDAYRRIFRRTLRHWSVVAPSPNARWRQLATARQTLDQFVARLDEDTDPESAQRLVAENPAAARLSLLRDE